jgi:hypothetical protein
MQLREVNHLILKKFILGKCWKEGEITYVVQVIVNKVYDQLLIVLLHHVFHVV